MDILIEQEIALHQFDVRQNKDDVARLIHSSFKEIGTSGTSYDFDGIVKMMDSEQRSEGYVHSQDFEHIQLDSSVHLLLYKSVWVNAEGIKSNFAKRSSIWVFTDQHWQLKYHQGTPCSDFDF